jgi:hypothetical protein
MSFRSGANDDNDEWFRGRGRLAPAVLLTEVEIDPFVRLKHMVVVQPVITAFGWRIGLGGRFARPAFEFLRRDQ